MNNNLLNKLLKDNPELKTQQYESLVVAMIREKYSQNEENAILRKKLAGLDTGEFEAYNTYVESCKTKVKEFINEKVKE